MQTKRLFSLVSTIAVAGTLGVGTAAAASDNQQSNSSNGQQNQQSQQDQQNIEGSNAGASANAARAEQTKTAYYATGVLRAQSQQQQTKQIPQQLLNKAQCIGVFPAVLKVGVVFAGAHGNGLVSCRDNSGQWDQSAPAFFNVSSGSVGAQAGARISDLVVLFNDKSSVKDLSSGSFKFGANTEVAAGPLGAQAHVNTQPAPIVAYRMDETGAYAGAEIKGTVIQADTDAIHKIYGQQTDVKKLLNQHYQVPENISVFNDALETLAPSQQFQKDSNSQS